MAVFLFILWWNQSNMFQNISMAWFDHPRTQISLCLTLSLSRGRSGYEIKGDGSLQALTCRNIAVCLNSLKVLSAQYCIVQKRDLFTALVSSFFFFISARAGKINQIQQSDWFRERAEFSNLARGQRNEPNAVCLTSKVSVVLLCETNSFLENTCS